MKCSALALAALVALPLCARAQTGTVYTPDRNPRQLPFSRFAVTPFLGMRVPYITGEYTVIGANDQRLRVEEQREGSPAVGLNLDFFLNRTFALTTGATFSPGQNDLFTFTVPGDSLPSGRLAVGAPDTWLAKAGLTARLPDPVRDERRFHPSAFVTVAPAVVHTRATPFQESMTTFALNVGADATTRIGRSGLALQIGLEDYITFWSDEDFRSRDEALFADQSRFAGQPVTVFYRERSPNVLLLRVGASYRPGLRRAPAAVAAPVAPPRVAEAPATRPIRVCVVQDGRLAEIDATYDPARADTVVGERTVAQAYPADALPYAASAPWYINNEPITAGSRRFVKYGLPRALSPRDLRPAGQFRGVPLFAEADERGETRVYYVPVRPGCEFQPYQTEAITGGVRGE